MFPVGDVCMPQAFTNAELKGITLLSDEFELNPDLFDIDYYEDVGNVYALMDEGVLKSQPTGADLGIYDYKSNDKPDYSKYINEKFVFSIDECDEIKLPSYFDNEKTDANFSQCILAQDDDELWQGSKIIRTFKGYLEISLDEYSIVRRMDGVNSLNSIVYMPQYYVCKYQLRNGDEIVGTCSKVGNQMVITSLFTINQISCNQWEVDRPWFKQLSHNMSASNLTSNGEYLQAIINKFGIIKGDNVFLYLTRASTKSTVLPHLLNELSPLFDQIIYINPSYKPTILGEASNVVKFCAKFSAPHKFRMSVALLGAQYARRMIEMGKNVAMVVDDIDSVAQLDKNEPTEMPVCKTVWNTSKATQNGSGTMFTIVSLKTSDTNPFATSNILKGVETLGVIIEADQVDLFNSYRV